MVKEEIKNFVEEYNKRMCWNKDIINQFGEKNIPAYIIDEYLATDLIDEDTYSLEDADLYKYDDEDDGWFRTLELQVYNTKKYSTTYFWINADDTEETYKSKKIEKIKEAVEEKCDKLYGWINSLNSEFKQYSEFKKLIW